MVQIDKDTAAAAETKATVEAQEAAANAKAASAKAIADDAQARPQSLLLTASSHVKDVSTCACAGCFASFTAGSLCAQHAVDVDNGVLPLQLVHRQEQR